MQSSYSCQLGINDLRDDSRPLPSTVAETVFELVDILLSKTNAKVFVSLITPCTNPLKDEFIVLQRPPPLIPRDPLIIELMEARLELPKIDLTNDANAAAIGEKIFGAAKDYSDFTMITLGTGLGNGVFVNN